MDHPSETDVTLVLIDTFKAWWVLILSKSRVTLAFFPYTKSEHNLDMPEPLSGEMSISRYPTKLKWSAHAAALELTCNPYVVAVDPKWKPLAKMITSNFPTSFHTQAWYPTLWSSIFIYSNPHDFYPQTSKIFESSQYPEFTLLHQVPCSSLCQFHSTCCESPHNWNPKTTRLKHQREYC